MELLMFLNVGSDESNIAFCLCCYFKSIWNSLFQEVVLLNPCLIFSKNLILPVIIDKVTTGT